MNYSDNVRKMLLKKISLDSKDLYIQSQSEETLIERRRNIKDRRRLPTYTAKDKRSWIFYQKGLSESRYTNPKINSSKKVSIINDLDEATDTPKFMRYNTTFPRMLKLFFEMSEREQLRLLEYAKSIIDERTLPRNPCLIPVNCTVEEQNYDGLILDINSCGAYIDTDDFLFIGQKIDLEFYNPFSRQDMQLVGKIIRSSSNGIGVIFND